MKKLIALVAAVGSAAVVIGPAWAANRIINISDSEKVGSCKFLVETPLS